LVNLMSSAGGLRQKLNMSSLATHSMPRVFIEGMWPLLSRSLMPYPLLVLLSGQLWNWIVIFYNASPLSSKVATTLYKVVSLQHHLTYNP
jgi:hypothetical protein